MRLADAIVLTAAAREVGGCRDWAARFTRKRGAGVASWLGMLKLMMMMMIVIMMVLMMARLIMMISVILIMVMMARLIMTTMVMMVS